jgi:Polysaccharide lyase
MGSLAWTPPLAAIIRAQRSEGRDATQAGHVTAPRLLVVLPVAALAIGALACDDRRSSDDSPAAAVAERTAISGRTASLEAGDFREFSESEALRGSLTVSAHQAYDGSRAAAARYDGGPGNGYARATQDVTLHDGQDVWYGAAFYLPKGFKRAMQGEVALLRWDNYAAYGKRADIGGVVLWGSDRRARLVLSHYLGRERILVGPFDLPEGVWFSLLVHQWLARDGGRALNEVYFDGVIIGSSTKGNTAGREIHRVRYGLVAISSRAQTNPLALWFDRCLLTSHAYPGRDSGRRERAWAIAPAVDERPGVGG